MAWLSVLLVLLTEWVLLVCAQNSLVRNCRELLHVYRQSSTNVVVDCKEERYYLYWRVDNRSLLLVSQSQTWREDVSGF